MLLDLMFTDGKETLHILHIATQFPAAMFLDSYADTYAQTVEGIWRNLFMTWFAPYMRYPNHLRTDQRSRFTSDS